MCSYCATEAGHVLLSCPPGHTKRIERYTMEQTEPIPFPNFTAFERESLNWIIEAGVTNQDSPAKIYNAVLPLFEPYAPSGARRRAEFFKLLIAVTSMMLAADPRYLGYLQS